MYNVLRQSTASQGRMMGPFVSDVNFKDLQTSLTINNTDVDFATINFAKNGRKVVRIS